SAESVDLVSKPATNKSIFEEVTPMRKTVTQVLMKSPKGTPGRQRLLEMVANDESVGDVPVEVQEDATPTQEVDAALRAALLSVLNDTDISLEDKLAKIADLVTSEQPQGAPVEEQEEQESESEDLSENENGESEEVTEEESEETPAGEKGMTESLNKRFKSME